MSDPTKVSRKLVAVFAVMWWGYSRLMGADEVGTLKELTERRAILDMGGYGGRIVNTAGDSVLAEGAVEAVQCAVEAQTALTETNSSLLPRLPLTGLQHSARLLLVPSERLVWSFGGRCDRAAGSEATSGNLGSRRGRLLCVDATR